MSYSARYLEQVQKKLTVDKIKVIEGNYLHDWQI